MSDKQYVALLRGINVVAGAPEGFGERPDTLKLLALLVDQPPRP